jgi:hypothetical protein
MLVELSRTRDFSDDVLLESLEGVCKMAGIPDKTGEFVTQISAGKTVWLKSNVPDADVYLRLPSPGRILRDALRRNGKYSWLA